MAYDPKAFDTVSVPRLILKLEEMCRKAAPMYCFLAI